MTDDARAIVRGTRTATWIMLPAAALLARVSPAAARALAGFAIGTIGIAHGASDDRILARLLPRFPGGLAAISAAYGAATIGVAAAAWRAPATASRALSLLSWYHFGSGDASFARTASARARSLLDGALRGAIPLCGPDTGRRTVMCTLAAAAVLERIARGDVAGAADLLVPAGVLAAVPAPLGFAAYFGLWHAPRHLAIVTARAEQGGSFGRRSMQFAAESAGNTALAAAFAGLAFALARPPNGGACLSR